MIGELQPWHLLILAAVVVLLFGAKKLPDSARSLGRAMRIFKSETKGMRDHDEPADDQPQAQAQAPQQLPAATPAGQPANQGGTRVPDAQRTNQPG
jgi:sec-independent protein translocase protein TatA